MDGGGVFKEPGMSGLESGKGDKQPKRCGREENEQGWREDKMKEHK